MGRPPTPLLSRSSIAEGALALLQEEGSFSLPRLAARLGVRQSSFYKHVSGRAEIIELVRGTLVARLDLDLSDADDLETVIRRIFDLLRRGYASVPALVPLMLDQPVTHPEVLALYDGFAGKLAAVGVPVDLVLPTLEALDSAAIGAALDAISIESAWQLPEDGSTAFPHLAAAQQASATDQELRFRFLADVLVAGLRSTTLRD